MHAHIHYNSSTSPIAKREERSADRYGKSQETKLKRRHEYLGAQAKRKDGTLRKITWGVRFAPDECDQLREKAYVAHTSISEFIRRAALGRRVVEPPPPPAVNIQTYRELASIGNHLSRLVTTVNRAVNMGQGATVDVENLEKLVQNMTATIKEVQLQLMDVRTTGGESDDREADN